MKEVYSYEEILKQSQLVDKLTVEYMIKHGNLKFNNVINGKRKIKGK